jgi:hypothetical protein
MYTEENKMINPETECFNTRLERDLLIITPINHSPSNVLTAYLATLLYYCFPKHKRDNIQLSPQLAEWLEVGKPYIHNLKDLWTIFSEHFNDTQDVHNEIILKIMQPIEYILQDGGDERTYLNEETQLGKYSTSMFPRDNIIDLSSCTANSITQAAYTKACKLREQWLHIIFKEKGDIKKILIDTHVNLKAQLIKLLGIEKTHDIILSPSGTDAEYIPNYLIESLHPNKHIINIVISPLEIGGGSSLAASDCFFSIQLPDNASVDTFEKVRPSNVDAVKYVSLRDLHGDIKSQQELYQELYSITKEHDHPNTAIIVHLVDSAKTGIGGPSLNTISQLEDAILHAKIYKIVDAAQFRIAKENISNYADDNTFIIITGSKFIGAPPFCGAVVVPKNLSWHTLESPDPLGLRHFYNDICFPDSMLSIAQKFPSNINTGLLIRWLLAIDTIEKFYQINSNDIKSIVSEIHQELNHMFSQYEYFSVLNEPLLARNNNHLWDEITTIYSLEIIHPKSKEKLDFHELTDLYKLLKDKHSCHLGQPVKISPARAVLRLALSANHIIEYHDNKKLLFDKFSKTLSLLDSLI